MTDDLFDCLEIWKDIRGYEGLYKISNFGRVMSYTLNKPKILVGAIDKYGYHYYCLSKNGKVKNHWSHRLVAEAFIPNPNNYPQINHKDEMKRNNWVENLEWCDVTYNCNYGTRNHRISLAKMGEKNPMWGKHTNNKSFKKSAIDGYTK